MSKPNLTVAQLPKPDVDHMVEGLEEMIRRVKAGEFVSFLIGAFSEEATFLSIERGKRMSRIQLLGILDCWKFDLLKDMET